MIVSLVEALWKAPLERREDLLVRLKQNYVRCDDEHCTTDPEVARVVLPYALRALVAPTAEARIAGIQMIELLAPDAYHLLPDLTQALSDPVLEVREAALEALGEFGPRARAIAAQVAKRQR